MSVEVLGSVAANTASPAPRAPASAALLDPGLLSRILAVATAVFAVPVLVELHGLLAHGVGAGASAPSVTVLASTLLAAGVLAAGFGALLLRAPRTPELRSSRILAGLLALEVGTLTAALALRLLR